MLSCLVPDPLTIELLNKEFWIYLQHWVSDETADYEGEEQHNITFDQKPHQGKLKPLNMAGDHQKKGNNNPVSDGAAFVQVVPIVNSVA